MQAFCTGTRRLRNNQFDCSVLPLAQNYYFFYWWNKNDCVVLLLISIKLYGNQT